MKKEMRKFDASKGPDERDNHIWNDTCNYKVYGDDDYIQKFRNDGVVVVKGVLTPKEVESARQAFAASLLSSVGCGADDLDATAAGLSLLSSTGGSGGVLDLFYEDWKLYVAEHPKVVHAMNQLWENTYASAKDTLFAHPFGAFDSRKSLMYVDRVCYRVPETVSKKFSKGKKKTLQRSLTPHLDCCPHGDRFYSSDKKHPKWRPIQAFVALTDTLNANEGGFEACVGFHKQFDEWAVSRPAGANQAQPPCVGDFTPIRPIEDKDVISGFQHIPCKAGDMVCWDYRIPHANSRRNDTSRAREAIYVGLLPYVPRNIVYAQEQLQRYRRGKVPGDQWHDSSDVQPNQYPFSRLGQLMMGMSDGWDTYLQEGKVEAS